MSIFRAVSSASLNYFWSETWIANEGRWNTAVEGKELSPPPFPWILISTPRSKYSPRRLVTSTRSPPLHGHKTKPPSPRRNLGGRVHKHKTETKKKTCFQPPAGPYQRWPHLASRTHTAPWSRCFWRQRQHHSQGTTSCRNPFRSSKCGRALVVGWARKSFIFMESERRLVAARVQNHHDRKKRSKWKIEGKHWWGQNGRRKAEAETGRRDLKKNSP